MNAMNAITAEELQRVIERAQRGENLARRRSPQPSVLVEYYRQRERQRLQVAEYLAAKKWKERQSAA